ISFLFIVSFLFLILFYVANKNKILKISLLQVSIIFLLTYGSILFKNLYFHQDLLPPFTGHYFGFNTPDVDQFYNFVRSYDVKLTLENFILLPLLFLIPHMGDWGNVNFRIADIGKIYGLQFYNFFFYKSKITKKFLAISIICFFLILLTNNISTRWFLSLFIFFQIMVLEYGYNKNRFFYYLKYIQIILFTFFLAAYSIYNFKSLIFVEDKHKFSIKNSQGYSLANLISDYQIKNKINTDKFYTISTDRAQFWSNPEKNTLNLGTDTVKPLLFNNNIISLNPKFNEILKNKKVALIVIKYQISHNNMILNSFKKECQIKKTILKAPHATRNIFNRGSRKYIFIHFRKNHLIDCLI
ncbi:hypothetical protein OAO77_02825, partial [Candidatus Pelagibacter sp.]|nr:hypothetical protein [Candidatus Pelagibacter sp.]